VEDKPPAAAGGSGPPVSTAGGPPPGAFAPGGTAESPFSDSAEFYPRHENQESQQPKVTENTRPKRANIPISYLHNQSFYTDLNPSSVCFQRQHQGELCPSSHACVNSTYNTTTTATETMGAMGTELTVQRDILSDEIIAVFEDATILQEAKLVNEFADLINAYNRDHPTQGFQYSIFYPVAAGDSHLSAVIPDQNRELALKIPTISRQLRALLRLGDPNPGLAHLANHTCCPAHRNAELQILPVWQGDREGKSTGGAEKESTTAQGLGTSTRSLVATLRATKPILKGMPILTCYRNTSSGGTTSQLTREQETLDRVFSCGCCLCKGPCGKLGRESILTAPPLPPASMARGSQGTASGRQVARSTAGATTYQENRPSTDPNMTGQIPLTGSDQGRPTLLTPLPSQMQLKWNSAAEKCKS